MGLYFTWKGNNIYLNFPLTKKFMADNIKNNDNVENNILEKGPLFFSIKGKLASLLKYPFPRSRLIYNAFKFKY